MTIPPPTEDACTAVTSHDPTSVPAFRLVVAAVPSADPEKSARKFVTTLALPAAAVNNRTIEIMILFTTDSPFFYFSSSNYGLSVFLLINEFPLLISLHLGKKISFNHINIECTYSVFFCIF
jgi:hypothetical protein